MTNPSASFVGSGTVGEIIDWSVTEEATPVSISDTSGGVGSATFNASATDDSVYLNDCGATLTHGTRAFTGRVMQASIQGAKVNVAAESALRVLNASRIAPPMGQWALPVTAIGGYGSGDGQFNQPGDIAFDSSGNMFVADRANYRIQKFTPNGSGGWTFAAKVGSLGSGDGQFGGLVGWLAVDSSDNVYVTDSINTRIQKFTNGLVFSAKSAALGYVPSGLTIDSSDTLYVCNVGGGTVHKYNSSLAYLSQFTVGNQLTGISYNVATGNLAICRYQNGSSLTVNAVRNYTTAGVYTGETTPPGVSTADGHFGPNPALPANSQNPYDVTTLSDGVVAATDLYGARIQLFDSSLNFVGTVGSFGTGDGQFSEPRGVGIDASDNIYVADWGNHRIQVFTKAAASTTVTLSSVFAAYVALADEAGTITVSYDAATDPQVTFPGWQDSVWVKLKQLCAAYRLEMRFVSGVLHVDDVGTRELDVANKTAPTLAPASVQPARSIGVVNHNVVSGNGLVMYDAATVNVFHEIAVGATFSTTLSTPNSPAQLNQPIPKDGGPIGSGQYAVQDSTGASVPAADWIAAGGDVSAYVGTAPGTIAFTINGPSADILGFTGPYSLAYTTGGVKIPALSISGAGITTRPEVVTIPTGADPDKVTSESLRVIDIPFIVDLERAYDAGAWAAVGFLFGQTVSFTIPADPTVAFGDYVGRKFTYKNARYRVTSAAHRAAGVAITAAWHTTVAEIDVAWTAQNVGAFDAKWGTHPLRDVATTPLLTT